MATQICLTPKPMHLPVALSSQPHIDIQAQCLQWRHIQRNVYEKGKRNTNLRPGLPVRSTIFHLK